MWYSSRSKEAVEGRKGMGGRVTGAGAGGGVRPLATAEEEEEEAGGGLTGGRVRWPGAWAATVSPEGRPV